MQIDRRKIRRSLGSRVSRRQGTKMNTSQFPARNPRPKTKMKNIIRDMRKEG